MRDYNIDLPPNTFKGGPTLRIRGPALNSHIVRPPLVPNIRNNGQNNSKKKDLWR